MPELSTSHAPPHYRWVVFSLSASLFFLSQFYRTSNAVIAPDLVRDLALDTKGLGALSAAFFYIFALCQIPITVFLDRVGPRRLMTGLSLVGVAGAVVFSLADSLALGIAGRVLLGIGMACNLMGTLKLLSEWFRPAVFATLTGVIFSIGTAGNMVSTTPLVALVATVGWRCGFQVIAAVNLALTIVFWFVVRDRPGRSRGPDTGESADNGIRQAFENVGRLFKYRDYWIISLATFVRYGAAAAFQALWAGPFLLEVMGYSALATGNIILLLGIGMILGGTFWGALSDRLQGSRKPIVVIGLILLALTMASLAIIPRDTGAAATGGLFFLLGMCSAAGLLMYPHIKDLVPHHMAGAAMTGINFFTMIGPAVFLQGLGALMQKLYPDASRGPQAFDAALWLCALCLTLAGCLYVFTKAKRDQDDQENAGEKVTPGPPFRREDF
jgi:predicted MFS family arabinose efflux permease